MRTLTKGLFLAAALLVAASADAKTKKPKKKEIQTGDPIPSKPVKDKACHDQGAVRFVGDEPSTPLAMVKKGKIMEPGQHCCAPWARRGSRWKTLDAYGQVIGEAELAGGEGYDVSQCYELGYTLKKGKAGVGLFVDTSEHPWKAPKSAAWAPTDAEKIALHKVVTDLEHAMVPQASWSCDPKVVALPFSARELFFTAPKGYEDADGDKAVRWAVIGGPILVIARLQKDGRWVARYVDASFTDSCTPHAYTPRAAFDMDADGTPEIVVHEDFGDSFGDTVLTLDRAGFEGKWVVASEAVAGSTA
ncbi:MAG: hypothetical protein ACXWUG_01415 [Polyangiales bacterium]